MHLWPYLHGLSEHFNVAALCRGILIKIKPDENQFWIEKKSIFQLLVEFTRSPKTLPNPLNPALVFIPLS